MTIKIIAALIFLMCGNVSAQFTRTEDLRVRPPEAWKQHDLYGLDLSVGGGTLSGNVDSKSFYGSLEFDLKPAERHSVFVQASDNYVSYGGDEQTDKSKGSLLYAYALTGNYNAFFQTTHSHDRFLGVHYRMTNTVGICHHNFLPGILRPIMVSAGLTPEYNDDYEDGVKNEFRGTLRINFNMPVTGNIRFKGDIIYSPLFSDMSDYRVYSEGFVEFDVWKEAMAYRITVTGEYDSSPASNVKKSDFGLMQALVFRFSK